MYRDDIIYYCYFIEEMMFYNIYFFMYKGDLMEEKFVMDKFLECVLVYKSDVEKEFFENYILDNWDKVNQLINENNKCVFGIEYLL